MNDDVDCCGQREPSNPANFYAPRAHDLVGRYALGAPMRLVAVACENCGRVWPITDEPRQH